ncbi:HD domain-containing protein [Desertifilum sp. FACHB-1129]|uniref:Phosphohydrolase n=2 Tax=Desertifilum tharense IPPAS B-1220 TaxID=1781255 RepID=A0A1E5QR80_9CYAN|nr:MULTISPECIES: HD domain-containing protein [Desertifilum]MDA0212127.1 HD domain-containing protein [Cyanobacteria bacterium FC1]MBD2313183.1 HD domain-containing protein [Desertifilum sp. FACHB-1129]MBD2323554.1 HD domain-containing protein [Desertifilum sp. FACHB-866]MBD2334085.1 HD domain-containing protein [Desertifilum sp. FACHB-868]OEJ77162.1 phosphohydrolase [Desertifilum tharense IPPAS B-1220]
MVATQLSDRFVSALVYAAHLHANQVRKDGKVPYIAHLLSVSALVLEDGGTEDEAIAGLLHDGVEDRGGDRTRQEIQRQFGDNVAAIVDGCTEPYLATNVSWNARKLGYIEQIRSASASVRRVSLADKLHNARSLLASLQQEGDRVWSRFNGGKAQMLWFYQALCEVYCSTTQDYLSQEFARVMAEIEAIALINP